MASSAAFLKKEPIDDLNDISYVNPEIEDKSNFMLTIEIFKESIFNVLPILLLILTDGLSLMAIGHGYRDKVLEVTNSSSGTSSESYSNLEYFNFYAIAVVYLNLFGFIFSLGTIHRVKKEHYNFLITSHTPMSSPSPLTKHYITLKCLIVTLTLLIIVPLVYASYFILTYIYDSQLDEERNNLIWHMYTNFLIFTPIFLYTQLLLQLNIKVLQIYNQKSTCLAIFLLHLLLHCLCLYIFVIRLNMGVFGVVVSITAATLVSYIYSNYRLINSRLLMIGFTAPAFENFYFICNYSDLSTFILNNIDNLNSYFVAGVFTYLEYAGFGFFLIFSYFISPAALTTNVILYNFIAFLHSFGKGFSHTLRHYVQLSTSSYKHSHIGKKKFIKFLSIDAFILALMFAVIILTLDEDIPSLFLCLKQPEEVVIPNLFSQICNFFALIIFFDYISKVLDGYVKGIDAKTTHLLVYKISFLVIFLPTGLILCFNYDFGLMGFWMVIYIYVIIYTFLNCVYVYRYYTMWIR